MKLLSLKTPFQKNQAKQAVMITGALTRAGSASAARFARRGHNLILVGRDFSGLEDLANRLWAETGVNVEIEVADLSNAPDRARIEHRLRSDRKIGTFVNTAHPDHVSDDEATASTQLAAVADEAFAMRRRGAVIHLALAAGPNLRRSRPAA
jgi:uncharacterized protein